MFKQFLARLGIVSEAMPTKVPGAPMDDIGKRDVIHALYEGRSVDEQLFADRFLKAVPMSKLRALLKDMRQRFGAAEDVTGSGNAYTLTTPGHEFPVQFHLDGDHRIVGLMFEPGMARTRSVEETLERLKGLDGVIAYLITRADQTVAAFNADETLAVASAFKIGVFAALQDQIAAGDLGWDSVVRLEGRDKSLPSGILQNLATASPLTVHSAAALMIAESDNTATDLLMRVVGRDTVNAKLGVDLTLTTRETFILKADPDLRDAFLADDADKHAVIAKVAQTDLPDVSAIGQHNRGVEWYVSARRLCALLSETAEADVMHINPGLARKGDWEQIAFKGGSEQGVLCFATRAIRKGSEPVCAVVTVNADSAIDEEHVGGLYTRLLQQLAALDHPGHEK
ncbi:MAG: serine hydrolase [Pseudomonadota bacterium]